MRGPAVAVLLGVAVAGCASKADIETMGDALRADIEGVREGQQQLLAQLRGGLDSLDAADTRRESTGRGEVERRVRRLEDLIGEVLDLISQNNQLLNDLYAGRSRGAESTARRPVDAAGPGSGGLDEPSQFYAMALGMYNRGNLETARDAFRDFLAENPNHEVAPDAQYYVGRTYEEADDIGNALSEYQRVTELYPDSNRAPAALYRRGMIEAGRGNTAIARQLFTQIESGYNMSIEAPLARRELEKLGG